MTDVCILSPGLLDKIKIIKLKHSNFQRDGLERKLTETREQLSQIKSSWSEKISHLEDQVGTLFLM